MADIELIDKNGDVGNGDVESSHEKIPTERVQWARKSEFMLACIGYAVRIIIPSLVLIQETRIDFS